jgi:single-strand selective monofunctional uracil DNA glycosylase
MAAAKARRGGRGASGTAAELAMAARGLSRAIARLRFGAPVTHVYDPLVYARRTHEAYLDRYAAGRKRVVLLGMNPGPFGMAQTGVPFGEVDAVRRWLGIEGAVSRPRREHPRRPVQGFSCPRSEVSGRRLWGGIEAHFGTPRRFFRSWFVANYCPLLFLEQSGRNRTPDKLPAREREPLFEACDRHLRRLVDALEPRWVIGVGTFAEGRARAALEDRSLRFGRIPHPSPANPRAQRDWAGQARRALEAQGVCS